MVTSRVIFMLQRSRQQLRGRWSGMNGLIMLSVISYLWHSAGVLVSKNPILPLVVFFELVLWYCPNVPLAGTTGFLSLIRIVHIHHRHHRQSAPTPLSHPDACNPWNVCLLCTLGVPWILLWQFAAFLKAPYSLMWAFRFLLFSLLKAGDGWLQVMMMMVIGWRCYWSCPIPWQHSPAFSPCTDNALISGDRCVSISLGICPLHVALHQQHSIPADGCQLHVCFSGYDMDIHSSDTRLRLWVRKWYLSSLSFIPQVGFDHGCDLLVLGLTRIWKYGYALLWSGKSMIIDLCCTYVESDQHRSTSHLCPIPIGFR